MSFRKQKQTIKCVIIVSAILVVVVMLGWALFERGIANAPGSIFSTTKSNSPKTATAQTQQPGFNKMSYSIDQPASQWVIVNKTRLLKPIDYTPADLVSVGNGQLMRKEAANALQTLMKSAAAEGLSLTALSGYRSYTTQQSVYAKEVARYGQAVADTESAKPGTSEHQTGWAVDMGGGGCGIEDCFGQTKQGKWLVANAYKYGFIIRYTAGKQSITGYRAEPWHIRYIGTDLASELNKFGQTMEEFFGLSN